MAEDNLDVHEERAEGRSEGGDDEVRGPRVLRISYPTVFWVFFLD